MPDYQKGKIYKLWSPSKNLVYYGSTIQTLSQRLAEHIAKKKINKTQYAAFLILDCEDYKIELVEEYPCNNKQQLEKKEGEYIKANECVNKRIEGRTYKQKLEYNRQYLLNYREANKEELKEYDKKNRETKKQNNAIYKWLLWTGLIQ